MNISIPISFLNFLYKAIFPTCYLPESWLVSTVHIGFMLSFQKQLGVSILCFFIFSNV